MHGASVPRVGRFVCTGPRGPTGAVTPRAGHVLSAVGDAAKPARGAARLPPVTPAACAQASCSAGVGSPAGVVSKFNTI